MRRWYLGTLFVAFALAQQPAKVPHCGLGGEECRCLQRTEAVRRAAIEYCQTQAKQQKVDPKKADALIGECIKGEFRAMHDKLPTAPSIHCAIAERSTRYDTEGETEGEGAATNMGPMCTRSCKPHSCRCDDGPECRFE